MKRFGERYGPWALVTGATLGIGRAFADELGARGSNVMLVARDRERLAATARELSDRFGVQTRTLALDLAQPESHEHLLQETASLDVGLLVAAAGFGTSGPFLEIDERVEIEMIALNCAAVLRQCRDFGRRFAKRGGGGIVLMGSLLGFQGVPRSANYAATKAYVQSLAEGLRGEFKRLNIDVIASAPGPVRSGFEARANMRMKMGEQPRVVAETTLRSLGSRTTVIPGGLSKLLTYSLGPLTRPMRSRILAGVMADMTKHLG